MILKESLATTRDVGVNYRGKSEICGLKLLNLLKQLTDEMFSSKRSAYVIPVLYGVELRKIKMER